MSHDASLLADVDALIANPRPKSKTPCRMGEALEDMTPDTRKKMEQLLDKSRATSGQVSELLHKWGIDVPYSSVTRHRRRRSGTGCACP